MIPTVDGREDHLARCIATYEERTNSAFQIIVIKNRPACGIAWNEGAELAEGDFLHFTADDLEPARGWDLPARKAVKQGAIPECRLFNLDGSEWQGPTGNCHVPFCSRPQWRKIGPHLPAHYYTDDWFTVKAQQMGYPLKLMPGYDFTHHWAQPGRGAGMTEAERMVHDLAIFQEAMQRAGL